MTRIGIVGNGEAGKDCVAEILRDRLGLRYLKGTSAWAADIVYHQMLADGHTYASVKECWEDRRNHRAYWARVIGEYNREDPVRMYRECLEEQDLLVGLRWRHEFLACQDAGIVDLWLYIERPGTVDPTNQILPEDCDYTILNNGSLEDLRQNVMDWYVFTQAPDRATLTVE